MLLTLSTTQTPATDLGYLLHKNPARTHTEQLPFGTATVFYHRSPIPQQADGSSKINRSRRS